MQDESMGIKLPKNKKTRERIIRIMAMSDKTVFEMADVLKLTYNAVYKLCVRYGLEYQTEDTKRAQRKPSLNDLGKRGFLDMDKFAKLYAY